MSATLREGQKIRRLIKVYGVELPVVMTITSDGIEFKVQTAKIGVGNTWAQIVEKGCLTPPNVRPAWAEGQPLAFLVEQAKTIVRHRVMRLDKKENA